MKFKKIFRWFMATGLFFGPQVASLTPSGLTGGNNSYITSVYAATTEITPTSWADLVQQIAKAGDDEITVNIGEGINGADQTEALMIKAGQKVRFVGTGTLTGKGLDSISVDKGAELTIDGPTVTGAQMNIQGQLTIQSGGIKDTKLPGAIVNVEDGGKLYLKGGEISGNESLALSDSDDTNFSVIKLEDGTFEMDAGKMHQNKNLQFGGAIGAWGEHSSITINGGEISNNQAIHPQRYAYGGAIYMRGGNLKINQGVLKENIAERGGAVAIDNTTFTMINGLIEGNHNGDYAGVGGGLYSINESKITIDGGTFNQNKANGAGGGLFISNSHTIINGGNYIKNESSKSGGALALFKSIDSADSVGITEIHAGNFYENIATGFWGGGAIYNDARSTLKMYNTLIKENTSEKPFLIGIGVNGKSKPASLQGGGVWNCPTGEMTTYINKGVAIFDNTAADANQGKYLGAGDDVVNIQKEGTNPALEITSRLLGLSLIHI